ncbi:MAG: hypothetical protein ABSD68_01850 [Candidatus Micrarchaeales archaeon]|jgi:uncharacterized coiled-coil DUF342 family protein
MEQSAEKEPQEVVLIRAQINEEKKKRDGLIDQLRRLRNKFNYKEAEYAALSKLSELNKSPKNLGRLKRLKGDIEFKIATEATTLNAEKELIKKLSVINKDLEDALKIYRFRRKVDLVAKDMNELGKALESYRTQVVELDKKLDALYANLRDLTSWNRKEERKITRRVKPQEHFEVSLEDIAMIKKKEEK